jgi:cyclopropane fatty-acyl-phospholipid synthase-like methyltransferase
MNEKRDFRFAQLVKRYDELAMQYEVAVESEDGRYTSIGQAEKQSFLELAEAGPDDLILDIGAGTGRISRPLAKNGAFVVALDSSREMLRELERQRKPSMRLITVEGNAFRLPFLSQFSLIVSMGMLDYYNTEEIIQLLKGLKNNLGQRGRMIFSFQNAGSSLIGQYIKDSEQELGVPIFVYTEQDVRKICEDAGLSILRMNSAGLQLHVSAQITGN